MAADVFSMLEQDHRRVERMLAQLAESEQGSEREQTVQQLVQALELHMKFEESEVYPLVESTMDDETAEEARIEHSLAREGLAKLKDLVSAPGFGAAVEMVKGGIGHHVHDEEDEVFPTLRQKLDGDRRDALAADLQNARQEAGMDDSDLEEPSKTDLGDASKAELLEAAREAGIQGRSSMSKDELREALQSR